MAITINTEPADQHAAYTDVIFKASTTRDDAVTETITDLNEETGVFGFPGKTIMIVSGTCNMEVDDTITGSGFSDSRLNRSFKVLLCTGSTLVIDLDWDAAYDLDSGTVVKANNNFALLAGVHRIEDDASAITSMSGFALGTRLTIPSGVTGFTLSQVIRITGTTSYNGIHVVSKVNTGANQVDITTTFVGSETGDAFPGSFIAQKEQKVSDDAGDYTFNIANILQSQLSFDLRLHGTTGIDPDPDQSVYDYALLFTERYDDPDGLSAEYDQQVSAEHEVINATRQHTDAQDIDEYLLLNVTKSYLTNQPQRITIGENEEAQLHFIIDDSIGDVQYRVTKFDSNGLIIGSTFVSAGVTLVNHRGVLSIESSMWDASTAYIVVTINTDPGGSVLVGAQRYDIDRTCYTDEVRFHWLNRLGGFDSYTFTGDIIEEAKTDRSEFRRMKQPGFSLQDRGRGICRIEATREVQIFSEYLNDEHSRWLEELVTSPEVYITTGTDLLPVVVTNRSQSINAEGLIQHQITYELSNDIVLQNG